MADASRLGPWVRRFLLEVDSPEFDTSTKALVPLANIMVRAPSKLPRSNPMLARKVGPVLIGLALVLIYSIALAVKTEAQAIQFRSRIVFDRIRSAYQGPMVVSKNIGIFDRYASIEPQLVFINHVELLLGQKDIVPSIKINKCMGRLISSDIRLALGAVWRSIIQLGGFLGQNNYRPSWVSVQGRSLSRVLEVHIGSDGTSWSKRFQQMNIIHQYESPLAYMKRFYARTPEQEGHATIDGADDEYTYLNALVPRPTLFVFEFICGIFAAAHGVRLGVFETGNSRGMLFAAVGFLLMTHSFLWLA